MKATLTFNLPDENHEHLCAVKGQGAMSALWEIQELLRNEYKYQEHTESEYELIEKLRECVYEIINRNDLSNLVEG